jgi:serine/threonine protein kinase/formylglycine-generating enzyme required for sulfatase activity/tetratricopeptide (TPR) repeat protein
MAVSLEQLTDRIAESGLMSRADVEAFIEEAAVEGPLEDGQQLARLLVKEKKLTAYQAQQIYAGKGKSLTLGIYRILDKLGEGGMGMVFKAEHQVMERIVAIKVLSPAVTKSPEALARFQREVKAAAKLDHPNIVTAHDADEAGGTHFLVMQYVEGSDFSALVRQKGPLSVEHAVSCILQAARGLEYAHARGVVHRDIKPANLLLDSGGTVKILDMGLARLDSEAADQDQLTGTGQVMGTVDYMAPEQVTDTRTADGRADIYALGITLWFLLTGRRAYEGESMMRRLLAHRDSPIPSLQAARPEVPPRLDEIFARMAAKTPEDRYQTMSAVIADLEQCQDGPDSSPSLISGPGEESLLNAFLDNEEPNGGAPAAPNAVVARKKQKLKTAQALEGTVSSRSNLVDTDPETHLALAKLQVAAPAKSHQQQSPWFSTLQSPWLSTLQSPWLKNPLVWIAAGGGAALLLLLMAATVFFVQTDDGSIRVEINDPGIEVAIKGTEIVLKQADRGRDVKLTPGSHTLVVQRGDDVRFETDKLILKQGDQVTVRVELLADKVQVRQGEKLIGSKTIKPAPTTVAQRGSSEKIDQAPPPAIAPFDETAAKKHQRAWGDYLGMPVEKEVVIGQDADGNDVRLSLVLVPPGEFLMGSSHAALAELVEEARAEFVKAHGPERHFNEALVTREGPRRRIRITRPFYLGKYEVTQAQWQAVMGDNPSRFQDSPDHPLERVSWNDIQPLLAKLNEGQSAGRMTFMLPTEAQWEYACRAGTSTYWHSGDAEEDLQQYAWYHANSGGTSHPVGQLRPNPFGLYDLHGNVREWCADSYAGNAYAKAPRDDPRGASSGYVHVHRGGGWRLSPVLHCRSAARMTDGSTARRDTVGFRLAATLPESVPQAEFPANAGSLAQEAAPSTPQEWQKALGLPVKWAIFEADEAVSEGGADLQLQPDGSLLAAGDNPDGDVYRITGRPGLDRVTAIRLEAIPDERLPAGGTGRDVYGNFHLGDFSIERRLKANPKDAETIPIATAWADFSNEAFPIAKSIDNAPDVGWDPFPRHRERRVAVFEPRNSVEMTAEGELVIRLQTGTRGGQYPKHNLGRFRLTVTDEPQTIRRTVLEETIRNRPEVFSRTALLAILQSLREEPEAAAETFAKALEETEDEVDRARIMAEAARDATSFGLLLESRPEEQAMLIPYVENLTAAGELDGAMALVSAAMEREPDNRSLLIARGKTHIAARRWGRAAKDLTEAIPPGHENAEDFVTRATVFQYIGKWDRAIADWHRALKLVPWRSDYEARLHIALLGSGNWVEAVKLGQRRFDAAPRDTTNWLRLAPALLLAGDDEGYETFRNSVFNHVGERDLYGMERGLKVCLLAPASADYVEHLPTDELIAAMEDPRFSLARYWCYASLALARLRSGDLPEAEMFAGKVIEQKGAKADTVALALTIRSMVQARQGNLEAARTSLNRSAELLKRVNQSDHDWLMANILRQEAEAALKKLEDK